MSDVKKLIEQITAEVLRKTAQSVHDKIYRDEPLIFTASQMKSYVPDEIREMKRLASEPSAYYKTEEYIFYRQAKFMENYEDDFEYKETFFTYWPTYQKMSNDQLRGYFSWRTKVRRGKIEKTSLSFVYVYIYELINMIGSDSAEEGFRKLKSFCDAYCQLEPQILRYVKTWLIDFAVYYDLDKKILEDTDDLTDAGSDRAMSVLQNYEAYSDEEIFGAICTASSYNVKNSRLYKNCPDDVQAAVCEFFRQASAHYAKKNKNTLCEKIFGRKMSMHYHIFESAIFYDNKKYTDHTYEISDSCKYFCKDGRWSCEKYYGNRKSSWLGDILRSIDSIMRQKLDFGNPINCPCETKWILTMINKVTDQIIENKKKNTAPKIDIDISKLAGIRRSADITRDKLMTEEEREEAPENTSDAEKIIGEISSGAAETEKNTAEKIPAKNDTPLDDNEYAFMRSLLYGEIYKGKSMPSVIADSINEKLFDGFGDVVIIFEGDKPVIIEDYTEELKGMIPE